MKTFLGNFEIKSGALVIGDPCYKLNSLCLISDLNTSKCGRWKAYLIEKNNEKQALLVHHEDFPVRSSAVMSDLFEKVSVDSGQICIHDRKYWGKRSAIPEGFFPKGYKPLITEDDPWYEMHCRITLQSGAGVIPFGCVTSTAYGDGVYSVEGVKKDKEFVAFRIHLLQEWLKKGEK